MSTILYYTILYYTILYNTTYTILYFTILYYTILCVLYCTVLPVVCKDVFLQLLQPRVSVRILEIFNADIILSETYKILSLTYWSSIRGACSFFWLFFVSFLFSLLFHKHMNSRKPKLTISNI